MIVVTTPQGILPRFNPRVLQSSQAQVAQNCVLESGDCRPLKTPFFLRLLSPETESVFLHYEQWIQFPFYSHTASSVTLPVNNSIEFTDYEWGAADENVNWVDTGSVEWEDMIYPVEARYYYTKPREIGGGGFKSDGFRSQLPLGVARPTTPPAITVTGTGGGYIERTSSYVYTRVTAWGEESAPSRPTTPAEIEGGQHIKFNITAATDDFVTHYRLYRSVAGAVGDVWLLVPYQTTAGFIQYDVDNNIIYDIPKGNIEDAEDGLDDEKLNVPLETLTHHFPPNDIHNLVDFANGTYGALSGRQVVFSETWLPYAWPTAYRYTLDAMAKGLGHINGVPVAFTAQSVYLFEGTSPDSYVQRRISVVQGLESVASIASTYRGVFFASKDGLCLAVMDGVTNLTLNVWTREQWIAMDPRKIIGFFFKDAYYAFFRDTPGGFILPLAGEDRSITEFELPNHIIISGYLAPDKDSIYLVTDYYGTRGLYEFDSGEAMTATWRSKVFRVAPVNFGAFKLAGGDGLSNVRIYTDGRPMMNVTAEHNVPFRLFSGNKSQEHEIEIEGVVKWHGFGIAGNMKDLANV